MALLLLSCVSLGCAKPSRANIELRKQNAELRNQVDQLRRQREADRAAIEALESGLPMVEQLPAERIEGLFTSHGLSFGRLTGGLDRDRDTPGDEALRVVITPTDQDGQNLKAAGSFVIEAFDLERGSDVRIGRWEIDQPTARQRWHGSGMLYAYVFELPWQQPPTNAELTIKVSFTDALTGRTHKVQKVVAVKPPPRPASAPAGTATSSSATSSPVDQ